MPFSAEKLTAVPELLFVLGVMVIVHEFGHFAAAKLCRVRVEAFAVGFGKRLFGFVHGGTDYRVNVLPLGGYVKMAGEMGPTGNFEPDNFDPPRKPGDLNPSEQDPGELQNHPRWQRTLITIAGPLANFILAFVLMTAFYMAHSEVPQYVSSPVTLDYVAPGSAVARTGAQAGDRILMLDNVANPSWETVMLRASLNVNHTIPFSYLHDGVRRDQPLLIENKLSNTPDDLDLAREGLIPQEQSGPLVAKTVADGSAGSRAGLRDGDTILSVNGQSFHSVQGILSFLQQDAGKPVELAILRNGQELPLTVTPTMGESQAGISRYQIGFSAAAPPFVVEHYGLTKALRESWKFNRTNSLLLLDVLKRLFTRQVSVKSLSSPIGMGIQVHQAFETHAVLPVVGLMSLISLNLGIFNLLPIPILDGGTVMFLAIESAIRRDINPQLKERFYQAAFVCIVLFAAVVIFNDITKVIHLG